MPADLANDLAIETFSAALTIARNSSFTRFFSVGGPRTCALLPQLRTQQVNSSRAESRAPWIVFD